jgi:5-methyltetrahydropteroyltriglutamate--homocysteine methyltransferase
MKLHLGKEVPLKKGKQKDYFGRLVRSFKLTNEKVSAETQIHTYMCYSEFNETLESIYAVDSVDSDVISIEASRSKEEITEKFEEIHYGHDIGLGIL